MNRAAINDGKVFENMLTLLHDHYRREGAAVVEFMGTRSSYRGGRVVMEKSPPDYGGTLSGGRGVWFDAKFTTKERYSHPKKRLHQSRFLWEHHQIGALCFILVHQRIEGQDYGWILWPEERWAGARGWSVTLKGGEVVHPAGRSHVIGNEFVPDWLFWSLGKEW